MKVFSEKINYGLSAIFELAKNTSKGFIPISEIAKAQNIPQNYLEQLLVSLKRSGLVESMRGTQGGYRLKKRTNEIKVIDVIEALETPIKIVEYSKTTEFLKVFWSNIEERFIDLFQNTIEDLIEEENKFQERLFYNI